MLACERPSSAASWVGVLALPQSHRSHHLAESVGQNLPHQPVLEAGQLTAVGGSRVVLIVVGVVADPIAADVLLRDRRLQIPRGTVVGGGIGVVVVSRLPQRRPTGLGLVLVFAQRHRLDHAVIAVTAGRAIVAVVQGLVGNGSGRNALIDFHRLVRGGIPRNHSARRPAGGDRFEERPGRVRRLHEVVELVGRAVRRGHDIDVVRRIVRKRLGGPKAGRKLVVRTRGEPNGIRRREAHHDTGCRKGQHGRAGIGPAKAVGWIRLGIAAIVVARGGGRAGAGATAAAGRPQVGGRNTGVAGAGVDVGRGLIGGSGRTAVAGVWRSKGRRRWRRRRRRKRRLGRRVRLHSNRIRNGIAVATQGGVERHHQLHGGDIVKDALAVGNKVLTEFRLDVAFGSIVE